jgi:predicted nuclease of predicted toxin-antitoxin system
MVDESSGAAVVIFLRRLGYDVLSASEIMRQAEDEDVLRLAEKDERILITNDKDFGELIFKSEKAHAGVILMRLRDESPENRVRVLQAVLDHHLERIPGNFIVATEKNLRVRHFEA